MTNGSFPDLNQLPPTTRTYLAKLGLDKIPIHTNSAPKKMKDIVSLTGELSGQGDRLKRARFQNVRKKLEDCHIYLEVHRAHANYGSFAVPLNDRSESPGMDAEVCVSFHPGGYQTPDSVHPPAERPPSVPPTSRVELEVAESLTDNAVITKVIPQITETRAMIEAVVTGFSEQHLRRLLKQLYMLDGFLGQLNTFLGQLQPMTENLIPSLEALLHAQGARLHDPVPSSHSLTPPPEARATETSEKATDMAETEEEEEEFSDGRNLGAMTALFRQIADKNDDEDDEE